MNIKTITATTPAKKRKYAENNDYEDENQYKTNLKLKQPKLILKPPKPTDKPTSRRGKKKSTPFKTEKNRKIYEMFNKSAPSSERVPQMTQSVPTLPKKGRLQSLNVVENLMQHQKAERHMVASTNQPHTLVAEGVASEARRSEPSEFIPISSAKMGAKNTNNLPNKELGGENKDHRLLPD